MARTGHIAGVIGLFGSSVGLGRLPDSIRSSIEQAALDAAEDQRQMGGPEDAAATAQLAAHGMSIREIDPAGFLKAANRLWTSEARALGVGAWLEAIRG